MKLILATKNEHKVEEFQRILAPLGWQVIPQDAVCPPDLDIEETGKTFAENAYLKAMGIYRATGLPTVADDSGLCVVKRHLAQKAEQHQPPKVAFDVVGVHKALHQQKAEQGKGQPPFRVGHGQTRAGQTVIDAHVFQARNAPFFPAPAAGRS